MANIFITYDNIELKIESLNGVTVYDRFSTRINNSENKLFIVSDVNIDYSVYCLDFDSDDIYLNNQLITNVSDLQENLKKGYTYKLVEYNSTETYNKISLLDADENLISFKEIYTGVTIADIPTISKIIDVSKNIIIKI